MTKVDPKKRVRAVLNSIHPLAYRIKFTEPDNEFMKKQAFIRIITRLKEIEDRRDFLVDEIGMDMTAYEDKFFAVIEDMFKLTFSKEQLALIQMYLYQLVPDKEWDGTITVEKDEVEKQVKFKTPADVWEVINSI